MSSRLGWLLLVFLALAGAVLAGLYMISGARMVRAYEIEVRPVTIPNSSEAVERGRYLVETVTKCIDCHGEDLGGDSFIDDPAIGRLYADNLTTGKGGIARQYTRDDWLRAIRHGVGPDKRPLLYQPAQEYQHLSDADLGAVLAYLKSLPPVDREPEGNRVGPLGRALFLAGQFPLLPAELIDHEQAPAEAPRRSITADYGEYLVQTGGCFGCHGEGLSGGPIPGTPSDVPPAANITFHEETGIGDWSEEEFLRTLRSGRRPDGTPVDPFMPWPAVGRMETEDLQAIWRFLETVPELEYGNR